MSPKKTKLLTRKKTSRWWLGCKDTKVRWAIKRDDDWWIVDSKPEKTDKTEPEYKKIKKYNKNKKRDIAYFFMIAMAIALGVSLALNLLQYFVVKFP
jgi:hypothetical protein